MMLITKLPKLLSFLLLFFYSITTNAQTNPVYKKYRVDTTGMQADGPLVMRTAVASNSETTSSSEVSMVPIDNGDNCSLSGPTSATFGTTTSYYLYCEMASMADYWEVSCGEAAQWYGDGISVQWNDPSCTSAIINARRYDGSLIASIWVMINMPPLDGGMIGNPNQSVGYGGTPALLTTSFASGGTCSVFTYQWQKSMDGTNFIDIAGATDRNYQPGAITATTYFRRKITCNTSVAYTSNTAVITLSSQPLNGGCITSGNQLVLFGQLPATINATVANSGNCNANYHYQWQRSTDNVYFSDIPGAIYQNLSFTTPLTATTYFQRKTTCGTEVKFTGWIKVEMTNTLPTTWYNDPRSGSFTKNNCLDGGTGSSETYWVNANQYSSTISKDDANQKAQNDVNANGQAFANTQGHCTWKNDGIADYYLSQNCGYGYTPQPYYVIVAANSFSSTISKADANYQAQLFAQNQANQYGTCQSVPTCNYSNCSGESNRCVDGMCEPGMQVFTDSYYDYWSGMWVCVYHYEWSDGAWSPDYQQFSYGGACFMMAY